MFGKNLKKLRKNLSVTQDEMAVLLNMSARTYASYEREENNPPYSMLRVLYSDHNVNLNWFVTGDGEMFNPPKYEQVQDDLTQKVRAILKSEGLIS